MKRIIKYILLFIAIISTVLAVVFILFSMKVEEEKKINLPEIHIIYLINKTSNNPGPDLYTLMQKRTGVPNWLLYGIRMTESGGDNNAIGDDGISLGSMQINERYRPDRETLCGYKYDPFDIYDALYVAALILKQNSKSLSGDLLIASYRQGVTGVKRNGNTSSWYVKRVLSYANKYKEGHMSRSISFSVDNEEYTKMEQAAKEQGFNGVSGLAKHYTVSAMNQDNTDGKTLRVTVSNYQELLAYASIKSFGTVSSFITFAAGQYMSRFPLTKTQQEQLDNFIENLAISR